MSAYKLGLSALAFEAAAWAQLALGGSDDGALALYFAAHGVASWLLALFAYVFVPEAYRQPRGGILMLLFCLVFFVPVAGFAGTLGALVLGRMLPRLKAPQRYSKVEMPELDPHQRVGGMGFRQAGIRNFVANPNAPLQARLRALVALQNVPARLSSPVLRQLLADPTDDVRLLAYGMLDAREQQLNAKIHAARRISDRATTAEERAGAARRLADLYWELIYQGLVHGELRRHALDQALELGLQAQAAQPADAALALRLGRLLHERGRHEEARAAYLRAQDAGMPAVRVLPYLAELAFEAADYAEVRRMVGALEDWQSLPRLAPIVRYWSAG